MLRNWQDGILSLNFGCAVVWRWPELDATEKSEGGRVGETTVRAVNVMLTSRSRPRFHLGNDSGPLSDMRHHLFTVVLVQMSPALAKSMPELADAVLKPLHTLVVTIVGSGGSQHQHREIPHISTLFRRVPQDPLDGGNVASDLRCLFRRTLLNARCHRHYHFRQP